MNPPGRGNAAGYTQSSSLQAEGTSHMQVEEYTQGARGRFGPPLFQSCSVQ